MPLATPCITRNPIHPTGGKFRWRCITPHACSFFLVGREKTSRTAFQRCARVCVARYIHHIDIWHQTQYSTREKGSTRRNVSCLTVYAKEGGLWEGSSRENVTRMVANPHSHPAFVSTFHATFVAGAWESCADDSGRAKDVEKAGRTLCGVKCGAQWSCDARKRDAQKKKLRSIA